MAVYEKFAEIYHRAEWYQYTLAFLEWFPALQQKYGIPQNGRLLDIACGTGIFCVKMSEKGWQSTGIDRSGQMLVYAHQNAIDMGANSIFLQGDMREIVFRDEFDLVTCLFDSMNYLLEAGDLLKTFKGVSRALKKGGWFVFDMNTMYFLAAGWQQPPCSLQVNTADLLVVSRPSYDYEKLIAGLDITGFIRRGELWERVDETHYERGYPLGEIKQYLEESGLEVVDCLGNAREQTPPDANSKRLWFFARKK